MRRNYIIGSPHSQPIYPCFNNLLADNIYSQAFCFLQNKFLDGLSVDAGDEKRCTRLEFVPLNQ